MTEQEWLACTEPTPMLEFLRGQPAHAWLQTTSSTEPNLAAEAERGRLSERQLWLFTAACLRNARDKKERVGRHIVQITKASDDLENAIVATERYAEGQVSPTELFKAWTHWVGADPEADLVWWSLIRGIGNYCKDVADRGGTSSPFSWVVANNAGAEFRHLGVAVAALLRDIIGSPFRTVVADPGWLTPSVVTLAQRIYNERAFPRMPELADALERAGCAYPDILSHCREPGEHVRGCWVVDAVLGKG